MMKKIVLTGAAGNLGAHLREPLTKRAELLLSTDIADPGPLYEGERFEKADLADFDQMAAIVDGADMVVHFGAVVDERPFPELLGPNFIGSYNIFEAAHRAGAKRVLYASSIHAVGMYEKTETLTPHHPHRPDTFYGLAKCFTEDLARMYWEKRGLEAVCMRICSCTDVQNPRALGTWLSYGDLVHMVERAIDTPVAGFTVLYGVSANDRAAYDNSAAAHLGYRPKDNAEEFAAKILASAPPADPTNLAQSRHGGPFASIELGQTVIDQMGAIDKPK